ncbi:hypothetical protein Tco_0246038 [Tanacetum coccineum]
MTALEDPRSALSGHVQPCALLCSSEKNTSFLAFPKAHFCVGSISYVVFCRRVLNVSVMSRDDFLLPYAAVLDSGHRHIPPMVTSNSRFGLTYPLIAVIWYSGGGGCFYFLFQYLVCCKRSECREEISTFRMLFDGTAGIVFCRGGVVLRHRILLAKLSVPRAVKWSLRESDKCQPISIRSDHRVSVRRSVEFLGLEKDIARLGDEAWSCHVGVLAQDPLFSTGTLGDYSRAMITGIRMHSVSCTVLRLHGLCLISFALKLLSRRFTPSLCADVCIYGSLIPFALGEFAERLSEPMRGCICVPFFAQILVNTSPLLFRGRGVRVEGGSILLESRFEYYWPCGDGLPGIPVSVPSSRFWSAAVGCSLIRVGAIPPTFLF